VAGVGNVLVACLIMRITTRASIWTSLRGEVVSGTVAILDMSEFFDLIW
jgi:hypothetical protein